MMAVMLALCGIADGAFLSEANAESSGSSTATADEILQAVGQDHSAVGAGRAWRYDPDTCVKHDGYVKPEGTQIWQIAKDTQTGAYIHIQRFSGDHT